MKINNSIVNYVEQYFTHMFQSKRLRKDVCVNI